MNVDPDGYLSIRLRDVKNLINGIVAAIPALRGIRIALKNRATKKLNKSLKTPHIRKALESSIDSGLSQVNVRKKERKVIIAAVINSIIAVTGGYTVGDAVVAGIKKVFKNRTYKKKGRTFYFFGKKQTYDYLRLY